MTRHLLTSSWRRSPASACASPRQLMSFAVGILASMKIGAAYVVDADDPLERARLFPRPRSLPCGSASASSRAAPAAEPGPGPGGRAWRRHLDPVHLPDPAGTPRHSRGRARPRPSSTPRPRSSWRTIHWVPRTGVWPTSGSALDASSEVMRWPGAMPLPGCQHPGAHQFGHQPRHLAGDPQRHHGLQRAQLAALSPPRAWKACAADLRQQASAASCQPACSCRARGLEVLGSQRRPRWSPAPPGERHRPVRIGLPLDKINLAIVDTAGLPFAPGTAAN